MVPLRQENFRFGNDFGPKPAKLDQILVGAQLIKRWALVLGKNDRENRDLSLKEATVYLFDVCSQFATYTYNYSPATNKKRLND